MATTILHVGKTGGMALRAALEPFAASHGLVLAGHFVTLPDVPTGDRIVLVVRDPVPRFVSAFNSRLRKGRPRNDMAWSEGERIAFARFGTADALAGSLSSPDPVLAGQARQAMRDISHVALHLTHWVPDVAALQARAADVLMVGWQPELAADFELLKRRLGLPPELRLPDDPVAAHRTPPGFPTGLGAQAEANLRDWYAADYPILHACLELRRRLAG